MKKIWALMLLLIIASIPLSYAATISGTAYDLSLSQVKGSILTANTTPTQAIVLSDSSYSIDLQTGNYQLTVSYYQSGILTMQDSQNVSIIDSGNYTIDFVLFPKISISDPPGENLTIAPIQVQDNDSGGYMATIALILLLIAVFLFLRKRTKSEPAQIPDDLDKIVSMLDKSGGRMNQKDIVTELDYSEAKVSLMLSDLEQRGIVKRFKKGRGNIVRLEK